MNPRWSLKQTVAPTSEPITVSEFNQHANIYVNDDDVWALGAIRAAREYAELVQQRQLLTATWRLSLDRFPDGEIKIPLPPLQSVSSIAYVDSSGTTTMLSSTQYLVSTDSEPGRITPAYSCYWPQTRTQMEAVKITFIAGYTSAVNIPWKTLFAIRSIAAELYANRELNAGVAANGVNIKPNPTYLALLEGERVMDFSGPFGCQQTYR